MSKELVISGSINTFDVETKNGLKKIIIELEQILVFDSNEKLIGSLKNKLESRNKPFITNIDFNYILNKTKITLIELANGAILQIGQFGISLYETIKEFNIMTKQNYSINLNHKTKFLPYVEFL